jgi:hypothetical protein
MQTNGQGNGNAHLVGSVAKYLADPEADTAWARAVLRDLAQERAGTER